MAYMKISFHLPQKQPLSDIIAAKLDQINFEGCFETETGIDAYIKSSLLDQQNFDKIIKELESDFNFGFKINSIKDQNWNEKWECSFTPVRINQDCVVRASFHDQMQEYKYEIIIEPKMSFGTGHHETTNLMMNKMFNMDLKSKNILDVGCGTGILSILAKMLGSKEVLGIDIDHWCIKNSIENVLLNSLDEVEIRLTDIQSINRKFDVVLVNMNRNLILSQLDRYLECMNDNSDLILSGFLFNDINIIREKSDSLGLRYLSLKNIIKWSLLHFSK